MRLLAVWMTVCAAAGSARAAAPPSIPIVERDGAPWVLLDGRIGAALGREVAVEWKAPWLTLRAEGRVLRTAAGWRLASVGGGAASLCWLPDPVRADLGRPALTPAALAAALTALGVPRRWDRDLRRLVVPPAPPDPAGEPEPAGRRPGPPPPPIPAIRPVPPPAVAPVESATPTGPAARAPEPAAPPARQGPPVIVVDAGHGGHDCGAQGRSGLCEKNITLDIARRLGSLLRERGAAVTMTRDDDRYLTLAERVAITRRVQADLFVSVHVNSSPNRSARGIETYVYGARAMGRSAEEAVRRENADANYMEIAIGDLEQQAHHEASIRVAGTIEKSLVERLRTHGRKKHRVEAAPFYVLARSGRPAVLIEVGFISHREEERKLRDPAYRRRLAESIAAGVDIAGATAARRPAGPVRIATGG